MHVPPRSITCTARTLSPFLTFTNDLAEQTASWKHKEKHQMAARRMTDEAPKSIRRRSCIRGHNPFSSSIPRDKMNCAAVKYEVGKNPPVTRGNERSSRSLTLLLSLSSATIVSLLFTKNGCVPRGMRQAGRPSRLSRERRIAPSHA